MIREELLDILCCPESKQSLKWASSEQLQQINDRIQAGSLQTVAGDVLTVILEGALIREDEKVAYPVREDIPVLLVSEGISLS